MDPLELLPPELWRIIFSQVKDCQDWLNLYRASPSFQDVVGDERALALLPAVFPHLAKHLDNGLNDLLSLRRVSKQWKEVVDKFLDSSTDNGIDHELSNSERKYCLEDSVKISNFLQNFSTHPGNNPFIGSSVRICLRRENTDEEMTENINLAIRLMDKFGSRIRKLGVYASSFIETTDAYDNLLKLLIGCVKRAQNLEILSIEFMTGVYDVEIDYPEQNSLLTNEPLPIISKLKFLHFSGEGEPSSLLTLQNIIVRMCCTPGILKGVAMTGIPRELAALTNLEEVIWSVNDEAYLEEERLQLLAMPSWPLSRLRLYLGQIVPLGDVVECVERFKETLTSLEIASDWRKSEQDPQWRLDLPHLKHLRIPFHERNFPLLANLSGLEVLRVVKAAVTNEEEMKQLSEVFERDMLEFSVWETLPELSKIKLEGFRNWEPFVCKVYSREKYERRNTL